MEEQLTSLGLPGLTVLELKGLTLEESLQALLNGKTILVKGLEQSRNLDVLVRLYNEGVVPVTQISYDVIPADGHWREEYWQIFDISINALSTYSCYLYDKDTISIIPKFTVGTSVRYRSKVDGARDSAIVLGIYKDTENNLFYKLSRDHEIYKETELTSDRT